MKNVIELIVIYIKKKVDTCQTILKSGKRKGERCNRVNCNLHKKKVEICQIIIKSGKRKGQSCDRINCKYHKNKKLVV